MSPDTLRLRLAERLTHRPAEPDFSSPLALACSLNPSYVRTPALEIVNQALVDVGEGRCDRLMIWMAPQETKTTTASQYGLEWMMQRNPKIRVGLVSYSDSIAERISYLIRNDITVFDGTDGLLDLGLRLQRDNKALSRWNLAWPATGGLRAIGIGSGFTGVPIEYLQIDDPVKDYQAADSLLLSEQQWDWWMSVARPRLAPNAPVVIVQTRWHEKDLSGRLLAKQAEDEAAGLKHFDRWRVVNIPAQADHRPELGETDPLGREPGEFMESARGRTQSQWEATKNATSARIWNALYQGRPSPEAGDVWQRDWWRRYGVPLWSVEPDGTYRMAEEWTVSQSWDFAFKDKKDSDYVVGGVWGSRGTQTALLDVVRARLSFTGSIQAMKRLCVKWPQSRAKLVEDKANGSAVIDAMKDEIAGLIAVNPGRDSKESRAIAQSYLIESGNVLLPDQRIALFDVEAFIDEAAAFPNGAHDDQVDMASQHLKRWAAGAGKATLVGAQNVQEQVAPATPSAPARGRVSRTLPPERTFSR